MICARHAVPLLLPLLLGTTALAQGAAEIPPPGPDELSFSISNMDPSVSPGTDFYRYASGAWLDRVQRPERLAIYGVFDIMGEREKVVMQTVLSKASQAAATAPKGSPEQQVGAMYNAYMDTAARDAAGMKPLQPQLDAIAAVQSLDNLARLLATFQANTAAPAALLNLKPDVNLTDSSRYSIFAGSGSFGVAFEDLLGDPPDSPRKIGYRTFLDQTLQIAGYDAAEAGRLADLALSIETELHAGKLPPVEAANPANMNNPISLADLQAQIPQLNLSLYLDTLGYPDPGELVLAEPHYYPVLSKLLAEHSLQDIKDYVTVLMITAYSGILSTKFDEPTRAWNALLVGVPVLPPLEERALGFIKNMLGQPVSQLYVDAVFTEAEKAKATDMIGRIKEAFAARLPTRDWLTDQTRAAAQDKIDNLSIRVGYPDQWIDYTSVDIGPDLVKSANATGAFRAARARAMFGKPVDQDAFNTPGTYPITVNAAYNPQLNGFEIPAAILQPPMFDASRDAAVNLCRIGAVIGHEMTHGFDSTGRQFDAKGDMRDWWAAEDAAAFTRQAQKLIDQANATDVLPGLKANGALEVGENMADVGGLTLAYDALQKYLVDHPDENVKIDGLTPEQRCFLSWAQMWTAKSSDEIIRIIVANDPHAPSPYRAVAAPRNLAGFYEAFGIKEGDPIWLPPDQRVNAW